MPTRSSKNAEKQRQCELIFSYKILPTPQSSLFASVVPTLGFSTTSPVGKSKNMIAASLTYVGIPADGYAKPGTLTVCGVNYCSTRATASYSQPKLGYGTAQHAEPTRVKFAQLLRPVAGGLQVYSLAACSNGHVLSEQRHWATCNTILSGTRACCLVPAAPRGRSCHASDKAFRAVWLFGRAQLCIAQHTSRLVEPSPELTQSRGRAICLLANF